MIEVRGSGFSICLAAAEPLGGAIATQSLRVNRGQVRGFGHRRCSRSRRGPGPFPSSVAHRAHGLVRAAAAQPQPARIHRARNRLACGLNAS